jgi:hypothetical protein
MIIYYFIIIIYWNITYNKMKFGNRGQSAWFDILIIFLSLMIFTSLMWAYTLTAKSPGTNNQMRMQDYTQSMLIRTLYTTYKTSDTDSRYAGKSVSDLLGMYLSNPDAFTQVDKKNKQPKLIKEALTQIVNGFQGRPEGDLEWFLFDGDNKDGFCFHIINRQVSECDKANVQSNAFTSSLADVYTAKSSLGGTGLFAGYNTKKVKLTIVWARAT